MNSRRLRSSGICLRVPWLGAGVAFVLGITGWASETPPDEASALFGTTEFRVHMGSTGGTAGQAGLPRGLYEAHNTAPASEERSVALQGGKLKRKLPEQFLRRRIGLSEAKPGGQDGLKREEKAAPRVRTRPAADSPNEQLQMLIAESRSEELRAGTNPATARDHVLPETEDQETRPGRAAADVEIQVGDHGVFERVVFEWPEEIEYDVTQRGEQVTISFSRTGRIDLSRLREGFGQRVVEAWAAGGEVTDRVVLRIVPDARIRTFTLDEGRIVAIDVYAEMAARSVPSAAPEPERSSVQALMDALEQRDAVIEDLLVRMEQLERKLALSSGDLDTVVAGRAGAAGAAGSAPPAPAGAQAPMAAQAAPEASASSTASESQGGAGTDDQAAPGEFAVAEEDIDRALERTLVQTGALLLPLGQIEVEPSFSYTRREGSVPVLFTENGATFVAEQDIRRNEFESGQIVRVGMPFDSQIEIGLPYRYVGQSAVTKVGGLERQEIDGSGQGMGDISVGVAKTLVRENGGWWPDLVARLTWDTGTGQTTDGGVLLGGGFNELRGSLNAVKRQDPLAFVGGVSYKTAFEKDDVKPGDELGFNIGTVLAASPETSLRLALGQRFIDDSTVDGEGIDGSDRVVGTATFGASVVLGRGVLLDVAADIGLTDDAPDYAARVSMPIRFDLPVH